jgi:hypothetical protein
MAILLLSAGVAEAQNASTADNWSDVTSALGRPGAMQVDGDEVQFPRGEAVTSTVCD